MELLLLLLLLMMMMMCFWATLLHIQRLLLLPTRMHCNNLFGHTCLWLLLLLLP